MKKRKENQGLKILIFLGIFGFSLGIYDNYRELWMSANGLSPETISRVISLSYIITVLSLLFFTIRSVKKIKEGITFTITLKLITGTTLICLNNRELSFFIKFFKFFDIAFTQIIISSIYLLLMSFQKSDEKYTKKSVVESLGSKLGFLVATILLGKQLIHKIDYNSCLLLSVIGMFTAFIVLLTIGRKRKF